MRTKRIKANITIPIPYNKPDDNKIYFTKESVENALKKLICSTSYFNKSRYCYWTYGSREYY